MNQLTFMPVFNPSNCLVVVVYGAFQLLQQGLFHVAVGRSNEHYEILTIAEVLSAVGNCTVNVVVEVLSLPKSSTQIAGLVAPSFL